MTTDQSELTFLNELSYVLSHGEDRGDRTGTGTRSVFGRQSRYDLTQGFPLLTTKRVPFKSVLSELLWFIEGSSDERRLAEILYGKPREELTDKLTIWHANAHADYWVKRGYKYHEGDLGYVYGQQWRCQANADTGETVDQLLKLVEGIKNDPYGRRHILNAWNASELHMMALPPCHIMSQFYVRNGHLDCQMYQRSNDLFLGSPFNLASYSMLTMMIAQVCGLKAGEFIYTMGDAHIYSNHHKQVTELLRRRPRPAPILKINPKIKSITEFKMKDFELIGYDPHPAIKAVMAV